MKGKGWHNNSYGHKMAAHGIKTSGMKVADIRSFPEKYNWLKFEEDEILTKFYSPEMYDLTQHSENDWELRWPGPDEKKRYPEIDSSVVLRKISFKKPDQARNEYIYELWNPSTRLLKQYAPSEWYKAIGDFIDWTHG